METLRAIAAFLTDPGNWQGPLGLPRLLAEHIGYSVAATLIAAVIALPIALWVGHTGRGGLLAINIVNVGRAVPTFGLIIAAFVWFGFGLTPVYIALVALAVPPIVTNAYVGIREVDPDARESAEGMGMTGWQMLRKVEVPVAMPLIMSGIRTSAVQVVATATLAAFVGLGGLGRPIIDGLAQGVSFNPSARAKVIVGAVLVAVLSVLTELGLARVERAVTPSGLRDVVLTEPNERKAA